jgi:hypothetical protein
MLAAKMLADTSRRVGWAVRLSSRRGGDSDIDMLPRLWNRVYADFLMPSRLDDYRLLLEAAQRARYRISSVGSAWRLLQAGGLDGSVRILVLRHDVDTDPRTAAAMWEIGRELGTESSFFFRLSTLAPALMADIAREGSEASYHYEEVATVAKHRRLRTRADAMAYLPEARDLFAANLERLRETTGLPMRVVASHGDFVNRRLGLPNWVILEDADFRRQVQVELETYDGAFLRYLPSRHIDAPPPRRWEPSDPAAAIAAGVPVVSVLVHPRHWRAAPVVNARDDIGRVFDGIRLWLPKAPRGRR